jgi:dTDP-4-dehydrorhamnose reductase
VKVLLTGASGQVGTALQASKPPEIELTALTHADLDLCHGAAVQAMLANRRPSLVINAAAYTAVDRAESDAELAFAINADGPRQLALAAKRLLDCRLIHISTDYVFDGTASDPYRPDHPQNPISVYGRSKLAGEQAVLEILGEKAVVLRTAWIYAPQGRNFLLTMLRLMRERGAVRVVADQTGSPTSARSIAHAIWAIAARSQVTGVLHWTDAGTASWYEFASAIAAEAQLAGLMAQKAEVTPITTAEYPTSARRPPNSLLDTRQTIAALDLVPPSWRDELHATILALKTA